MDGLRPRRDYPMSTYGSGPTHGIILSIAEVTVKSFKDVGGLRRFCPISMTVTDCMKVVS